MVTVDFDYTAKVIKIHGDSGDEVLDKINRSYLGHRIESIEMMPGDVTVWIEMEE